MRHMGETVKDMLVRQGIEAGRAGNTGRHERKGPGAASDGALGGVVADAPREGMRHRPTAGGGNQPMGKPRKGPRVNASAKFTGLRVVVDNSRCKPIQPHTRVAPRGIGFHLVLVQ